MKCVNCGHELRDDSEFCTQCGCKQPVVDVDEVQDSLGGLNAKQEKSSNNKKMVLIITSVVVVLVLCFIGWSHYSKCAFKNRDYTVQIGVKINKDSSSDDSIVPVCVVGKDLNDNKVEMKTYFTSQKPLKVKPGNYTVSVIGPIASDSGDLYIPDESSKVEVNIDEDNADTEEIQTKDELEFDYVDAVDVTDEQIEDLKNTLDEVGVEKDTVDKLVDTVTDVREEKINEKYTISNDQYEFVLPEYLRGKVKVEYNGAKDSELVGGVTIRDKDTNYLLLSTHIELNFDPGYIIGGDAYDAHTIYKKDLGNKKGFVIVSYTKEQMDLIQKENTGKYLDYSNRVYGLLTYGKYDKNRAAEDIYNNVVIK